VTGNGSLPVVACTLAPEGLRDRREDWQRVLARGAARVQPTPDGVRVLFAARGEVPADVRRLAALETECCSFARWSVREDDGEIVLDVRSQREGVAAVRAMFTAKGE
jgi:hypothetical protein